jgi:hypothetical protein
MTPKKAAGGPAGSAGRLGLDWRISHARFAANLERSDDNIRRLDEITAVALGYPHEFNAAAEQSAIMTGGNRWDQIDIPTRTLA